MIVGVLAEVATGSTRPEAVRAQATSSRTWGRPSSARLGPEARTIFFLEAAESPAWTNVIRRAGRWPARRPALPRRARSAPDRDDRADPRPRPTWKASIWSSSAAAKVLGLLLHMPRDTAIPRRGRSQAILRSAPFVDHLLSFFSVSKSRASRVWLDHLWLRLAAPAIASAPWRRSLGA